MDSVFENNVLLTQTERLMMSGRPKEPKYARNKNILVIGGSGSGKTRFFVKPNLMQMHSSYVVTDPKGTVLVECGKMLKRGKYKIKVLNTINFAKSMHYNPFAYIRSEKDILKLVNTIIVNTKGEGQQSGEDFWVKAEKLYYTALIDYIWYEAPEEEQNFAMLIDMIDASEAREDDENFKNAVDLLFEELEADKPNHFAVRQYKKYKLAAGVVCSKRLLNQAVGKSLRTHISLVANRLLCATGEKHLYETVKAEFSCGGYTFATSGKSVLKNGWKDFEDAFKRSFKTTEEKEQEDKKLPELSEGQTFDGVQTKISEHYTTPPKHFTEDSLLSAMERAGNEDMSDDVERKGLGTPATRADIIEKLVKDGFVKREKKQMIPTEDGMKLITVLPDVVKSPKLTADWENALTLVAKGEYSMQEFMDGIAAMVKNLVQTYHSISDEQKSMFGGNQSAQEALGKCPKCGGDVVKENMELTAKVSVV